jgi:hypothetical protein
VAALLTDPHPEVIEAIWARLREGSWVSPQLAVAAAERDDDFDQRAEVELRYLASAHPAYASKSAAALDALLGGSKLPAARVLADSDEEFGASIALQWRDDFRYLCESPG